MNKTRAFICIDLPDEIVEHISHLQSLILQREFTGKITEQENLHLTLKFLGEVTPETLEKVKLALSEISFPEFKVNLGKAGIFSYRGMPRIVWIKLLGRITLLQKEIDLSLSDLFPKENRFMSHLTIARVKYVKDIKAFLEKIRNLPVRPLKFGVDCFKLKSSELHHLGPVYETLKDYKLSLPFFNELN